MFIISLMPLIGLVLLVGLIALVLYNSQLLSEAFGHGMARKRAKPRKKKGVIQYLIAGAAWAVAIVSLSLRPGGLFGTSPQVVYINGTIAKDVSGNNNPLTISLVQSASQFSSFVQTGWIYIAFYSLLVVSSVVLVRGYYLSWKETRAERGRIRLVTVSPEAVASITDAFRILSAQEDADPRTRIINCYQRMVQTAQRLGASVTSDQTARELEAALNKMLNIKGQSLDELTLLFEEARYSIHPITEADAEIAQQCLLSIAQEMNIVLTV